MKRLAVAVCSVLVFASLGLGWFGKGHERVTGLAMRDADGGLPKFFVRGTAGIAHVSLDPDLFRQKENPALRNAEVPDHYLDMELLAGEKLPPDRYGLIDLCARKGISPYKVGTLPYAVAEWTGRLTVALAEYRRWPDDPAIQSKCLVYAGLLAHYARDLCQPLHTTIDFDGRNGQGKGIHAKVDALLEQLPAALPPHKLAPKPYPALWPAIVEQLDKSHQLVDRVYELQGQFPVQGQVVDADSPVGRLGIERMEAAADFTTSLYLTIWKDSASFPLPEFHTRAPATSQAARTQPATRAAD